MSDYDPKSIPVLNDIIEDESDDAPTIHEKIIINDEISADDNTLDLFNETTTDIEIDQTEPEIGIIDDFIEHTPEVTIKNIETQDETSAEANHTFAEHSEQQEDIAEPTILSSPIDTNIPADLTTTLDSIIDDVVSQLMPDLEHQLRSLMTQALQEKLPQEIIEQLSTDTSSENNDT